MRRRLLWSQVVALWVKVACSAPELKGKPGPESRVVAAGIEVPTGAPRHPDGALHPLLHLCIECLLNLGPYLDSPHVSPLHRAQAVQDVVDLRLDHEDHRIVSQSSIWTDEQEHVGKSCNGRPKIGMTTCVPAVCKCLAAASMDILGEL